MSFNKNHSSSCQVLKGNVRFRHDRTLMYCDSAYFYSGQNSFDAFGHVRVIQDTVTMTSNKMFYDGNIKLMRIRENITMRSGSMTLYTEKLDYYRDKELAVYDNGAKIVDPQYTLTSRIGNFYSKTNQAIFRGNVDLVNKDYKIKTDTLFYNTKKGDAEVHGASTILYDQYVITTKKAFMNGKSGDFMLFNRSLIVNDSSMQRMTADTIYFNQKNGVANAYGNIDMVDDKQHFAARGGEGHFNQKPLHTGMLTRKAYVMEFSEKDTLYLHADTLNLESTPNDSDRIVHGLHNVRFYRDDFQGKGETVTFYSRDSMMQMENNPVLWSDENQLSGDTVQLYLKNRKPDWLHIMGKALIIQRDDSVNYNQLGGKDLKGYFIDNNLRRVFIKGNAVSVYFAKDNYGDLIGVNRNEGSQMTIYLDEKRKLERILLEPGTTGSMYPPFEAPKEFVYLNGFSWHNDIRPKKPMDIFSSNN